MKKGVLILNCARGEIVNTGDMVAALQSGQVAGYGADVLDQEPPPADHPLLSLPNFIFTPHVSSRTLRERATPGHHVGQKSHRREGKNRWRKSIPKCR